MLPACCGNTFWFLVMICGLWQLQPTTAIRQSQQNTNPTMTQFGTYFNTYYQCFEKIIFAKSRSPTAMSHMAAPYKLRDTGFLIPLYIKYIIVETLDDTHAGANVEIINGAIGKDNIVLSITDGNRKPFFKSTIKVSMFCFL